MIKPKVGDKFLVRKDFLTPGCHEFKVDMKYWQKHPVAVHALRAQDIVVRALRKDRFWTIELEDLVKYRGQLENK